LAVYVSLSSSLWLYGVCRSLSLFLISKGASSVHHCVLGTDRNGIPAHHQGSGTSLDFRWATPASYRSGGDRQELCTRLSFEHSF
jgi:hypothetical protein